MKNEFLCPICGQEADICIAARIKCMTRLDLPYFVCAICCTVYYDKPLIKKCVSSWRNKDEWAKKIPFKIAYREAKEMLDRIMEHREKEMGYKFMRFKKK